MLACGPVWMKMVIAIFQYLRTRINFTRMKFNHVTPILYSSSVVRSIQYYTDILGFENKWYWGHPPTFGGVSKNDVEIFFCKDGQGQPGTWLSVFVENVDQLYEEIKARGAHIISAPQTMEWNIREMLVEDPDGHRIRFGHSAHTPNPQQEPALPPTVKIIHRRPTMEEHLGLFAAVGWSSSLSDAMEEKVLAAPVFAVVAEDTATGTTIGCALLLGDDASFYYVKDVMVHPQWQHKRVGTALMEAIVHWLDNQGSEHALTGLYTGDSLCAFYEKFGFYKAFGMNRKVKQKKGI